MDRRLCAMPTPVSAPIRAQTSWNTAISGKLNNIVHARP